VISLELGTGVLLLPSSRVSFLISFVLAFFLSFLFFFLLVRIQNDIGEVEAGDGSANSDDAWEIQEGSHGQCTEPHSTHFQLYSKSRMSFVRLVFF
jgi:hypothetical protein